MIWANAFCILISDLLLNRKAMQNYYLVLHIGNTEMLCFANVYLLWDNIDRLGSSIEHVSVSWLSPIGLLLSDTNISVSKQNVQVAALP